MSQRSALGLAAGTANMGDAWKPRALLSSFCQTTHDWERLETLQRQWVEVLSKSADRRDPDALANALRDLARTIDERRPEDPEATTLVESALRLDVQGETRRHLLATLARRHLAQDRVDAAIELLEEAVRDAESEPLFDSQEVSNLAEDLAEAATQAGRLELAENAYRSALAAKSRHVGPGHPDLARYRESLAEVLANEERWVEARSELVAALEATARARGASSPSVKHLRNALLDLDRRAAGERSEPEPCVCTCDGFSDELRALRDQGRIDEAMALAAKRVAAAEVEAGPISREVADALADHLHVLRSLGGVEAADTAKRRFEVVRQLVTPGHLELSDAAGDARYMAATVSRTDDVLRFAQAEVVSRQASKEVTADLAVALEHLGQAYHDAGDSAREVEARTLAVDAFGLTFGPGPELRDARRDLADALRRAGRYGEGEELIRDLLAELEPIGTLDRWNCLELDYALGTLGRILEAAGRKDEAREVNNRRQALPHYQR